jgi:hypothetical protein
MKKFNLSAIDSIMLLNLAILFFTFLASALDGWKINNFIWLIAMATATTLNFGFLLSLKPKALKC